MKETYKLILEEIKKGNIDKSIGLDIMKNISKEKKSVTDIAIVGIGGIFPKSDNVSELWDNLIRKNNFISKLSYIRKTDLDMYLTIAPIKYQGILKGAMLDRIDEFDNEFFKIPPKEASLMNPAQRLLFHCAYSALIDAGLDKEKVKGKKGGVYVGYCDYIKENYGRMVFDHSPKLLESSKVGNMPSMFAGRLSRFLNISGPSLVIDTACSSSLAAVSLACKDLLDGNIEFAIASGVRINNLPMNLKEMNLGIDSTDSFTRTFDENSTGAGFGEGVGSVILKRLEDAKKDNDYIYSIIKGYSLNNESEGISVSAPTIEAQMEVIVDAWKKADINPEDIGYIELHGTATRLGDSIEFEAIDRAFKKFTNKKGICAVGSAKSMFGHLSEAAGILSLIKVCLMLDKKVITPTVNYNYPNKNMNLINSSIYVNTEKRKWESKKLRVAGINSFGISGLNCHMILEEYPNEKHNYNKPYDYKFNSNRCWYTDYLDVEKKLEYYDYVWIEDNEVSYSKKREKYGLLQLEKNELLEHTLKENYDIESLDITKNEYSKNIIVSLLFCESEYNEELLKDLILYFKNLKDKEINKIILICSNVYSVLGEKNYNYPHSIFIGFLKVIAKEIGVKELFIFDIDNNYDALKKNFNIENKKTIAFRNNKLYTKLFEKKILKENIKSDLKEKGVYLITGGLGGIGFECAKYMSKIKDITLILIGKSLDSAKANNKLESLHCNTEYYKADISNYDDLENVIKKVLEKYKTINGIINSAGTALDIKIEDRENTKLINEEILNPKVKGMENLICLTKDINIDFFMAFSSVATVFPMIGQSDYVAANLYMENLLDYYRANGRKVKTILWTSWKETGLTFRSGVIIDTIFKTITNKEGINYLDAFFKSSSVKGILGKINDREGLYLLNASSIDFHKSLTIEKKKYIKSSENNLILKGSMDDSYSDLQYTIGNIVNDYLGYKYIDINDTFFELGMDSIILLKVQQDLEENLKVKISAGELFEYSTIKRLEEFITNKNKYSITQKNKKKRPENKGKDIAIVGVSANLPQCENKQDFINGIMNGFDFSNKIKGLRKKDIDDYINFKGLNDKVQYLKGSFLERIDTFDNTYFNISPNEAKYMAPEQRLALQSVVEAIEDAGFEEDIRGTDTETYIAYSCNPRDNYGNMIIETNIDDSIYSEIGNTASVIGGRIAYYLDLKGRVINVDTACSSGLTALNMASESIREGKCKSAIVCGIKVINMPISLENQSKIGIMSFDGKTRTFDNESEGFGAGEGVITFILKEYEEAANDRDNIYAVIKGIGVNSNGKGINISSPSLSQQIQLLEETIADADINIEDINYIETHGTATKLGDDIETKALCEVFKECTKNKCAVGSSKANIGHMSEASGLLGVLKVVLSMKNNIMPPQILFNKPNTNIDFINSPFYVNLKCREWKEEKKIALVSSFGISGTNAQAVIQAYKKELSIKGFGKDRVFVLSAKTVEVLQNYIGVFYNFICNNEVSLDDLSFTLCSGRRHYNHRIAFKYRNIQDLKNKLKLIKEADSIDNNSDFYGYGYEKYCNLQSKKVKSIEEGIREFLLGTKVQWNNLFTNENKISLPTYPFLKERHWIDIDKPIDNIELKKIFYEMEWIESKEEIEEKGKQQSEIFIFITESHSYYSIVNNLLEDLRNRFQKVFIVDISKDYVKVESKDNKAVYVPLGDDEKSIESFIYNLRNSIEYIMFYTENFNQPINEVSELKYRQRAGVINLFNIIKSLAKNTFSNKIKISVITNNAVKVNEDEEEINYADSSIIGFLMCVKHEYPNMECKVIDIDSITSLQSNLNYLFTYGKYNFSAIRNNKIFIRRLKRTSSDNWSLCEDFYRKNGVYIITGGTGEIGLVLAENLIKHGVKKIVLFSSKSFPEEENFKEVKDEYLIKKIEVIEKLRKEVDVLEIFNFDISDEVKLNENLDFIRKSYGKIKGIFHLAGRSSNNIIINKTYEDFNSVISSKIYGTWLLDQMTKRDKLDFIVCFSSGVTLDGEGSQSDYTAGNYFMNAYCDANECFDRKLISIQWTTWKDVGMGRRAGINKDGIFKALDNKHGLYCVDKSLGFRGTNLLAGELNTEFIPYINKVVNSLPYDIADDMINEYNIDTHKEEEKEFLEVIPEKSKSKLIKGKDIIKVKLKGKVTYEEIEDKIALCFASVLGYSTIDVNDSFFELGGDSILLTRLQIKINDLYPNMFTITDLFEYNSISKISSYIKDKETLIEEVLSEEDKKIDDKSLDIAIVGVGVNLSEAESLDEFYKVLNQNQSMVKEPDSERKYIFNELMRKSKIFKENSREYTVSSYLNDIDKFDYKFFNISRETAEVLDPAQRIIIENVYKALEDSGYNNEELKKESASFYLGYSAYNEYSYALLKLNKDNIYLNKPSMIAKNVASIFGINKSSISLDTACSSSLLGIHLACNDLKNRNSSVSIVTGGRMHFNLWNVEDFNIGVESQDGLTRCFDKNSTGTSVGEGFVTLVLMPLNKALKDNKHIYGVIKGSAVNENGSSLGITVPNQKSQEAVIEKTLNLSGINIEDIKFIECHGTATKIGDNIEINALNNVFRRYTNKKGICAIGSVKSNYGHLCEGSGILGLLKVLSVMKYDTILPNINLVNPNINCRLINSPFYIPVKSEKIKDEEYCCALSSFGLSGTNCHMILEKYNKTKGSSSISDLGILKVSAESIKSMELIKDAYKNYLICNDNLEMFSYTANVYRGDFKYRKVIFYNSKEDLIDKLQKLDCSKIQPVKKLNHKTSFDEKNIRQMAENYINGADVKWKKLYNKEYPPISIPGYKFDRRSCWPIKYDNY